jgi:hypothetical protein
MKYFAKDYFVKEKNLNYDKENNLINFGRNKLYNIKNIYYS